jgi:sugar-specific transcriptional regulator TrmB
MTNNSLTNVLSSLSCNEGEIAVYMYLAKYGATNISTVAKKLHLSRTTTYVYIETLLARKLIITTKLQKRMLYNICDPSFILSEFERVYEEGTQALNSLSLLRKGESHIPVSTHYTGEKEINSIFTDITQTLPKGGTYFRYTSRNGEEEKAPVYQILRSEKDIERLVITSSTKALSKNKDANRFIKTVPKDFAFNDNVTVMIYANKVAYIDYDAMAGVVIESPKLARFQEKIFKLLWKKL